MPDLASRLPAEEAGPRHVEQCIGAGGKIDFIEKQRAQRVVEQAQLQQLGHLEACEWRPDVLLLSSRVTLGWLSLPGISSTLAYELTTHVDDVP